MSMSEFAYPYFSSLDEKSLRSERKVVRQIARVSLFQVT